MNKQMTWLVILSFLIVLVLCSCSEKEEYGPQQKRMFAVHTGYHDYQKFVEKN